MKSAKIEIFITTAKRAKWCLNLLHDIKEQGKKHNYNVRVFHDCCDHDYSKVVQFCNVNKNFFYYKTTENMGRNRFWLLNNLMYKFLNSLTCDFYIQMPDDILLVDNFFARSLKLIESEIDVCNFFTPNITYQQNLTANKYEINGSEMWNNNWVDCCFIAKFKVLNGFQLEPVNPNRWTHRKHTGSGVGSGFVKEYNKMYQKTLHQTLYSLCEHIGAYESSMHSKIRAEKYYHLEYGNKITYCKNNGNPILMNLHDSDKDYMESKVNNLLKKRKI